MIILPSTYLGNIAYFHLLFQNKEIGISSSERYVKQTYRSRCTIFSANGLQNLSIPVVRTSGRDTIMEDVQISYSENWQKDHLKALEAAYNRTPYYEFYVDQLESIYAEKHSKLLDFNLELCRFLIEKTGLECELTVVPEEPEVDMKKIVDPKQAPLFEAYHYLQTHSEKYPFEGNLSMVDLLFNEGPNSISILTES